MRTIVLFSFAALLIGTPVQAQESTTSPHGVLSKDLVCTSCHRNDTWSPLLSEPAFNHSLDTAFPLDGQHIPLSCITCHESLRFDVPLAAPNDCETCHETPHALALSQTCADCHSTASFQEVMFEEMHWNSEFELIGAHETVACETCHAFPSLALQPGVVSVDAASCVSCHAEAFDSEHGGSGFPSTCLDCHRPLTWEDASFDHASLSGFELVGAHEVAVCVSCHVEPGYELTFSPPPAGNDDCLTCHQSDYDSEHGGGFPETCIDCHNQSTWEDASFDHLGLSGFELVGAHEVAVCASCHVEPGYELTFNPPPSGNEDCLTCHQSDYDSEHGGAFPETCLDCHNQSTWEDASFDHTAVANGFDLIGVHEVAACESCHTVPSYDLVFSPPPSGNDDCITCHQSDYDGEHAGSNFPTTCLTCHNQMTWDNASFNHPEISNGFELIGAHEVAACESCHTVPGYDLVFSPPPSGNDDCITCHQSDYDSEHGGSNFPTTCLTCHNQVTWDDASFSHPEISNGFELIGAHEIAACESCHTVPGYDLVFSPPPSGNDDCITCHRSDYDGEHAGSGFPVTCLDCHNQSTWDDASFDHDALFFPIYSGEHRGEWNQCSDCHRSAPLTYATFSCIDCHEHSQSRMNDEHDDVSGYVWESSACLSCHPDGRE